MLKIKVELPFSWVLKNRNDNVLPIEAFKNYILEKFEKDYEVTSSNLTEIYIDVKNKKLKEDAIKSLFTEFFVKNYALKAEENILKISFEKEDGRKKSTKKEPSTETPEEKPVEEKEVSNENEVDLVMQKISSLIGCEEFKNLSEEIKQISKELLKNNTLDVFSFQGYIFSINEGYGQTTYLNLFAQLLSALKIRQIKNQSPVVEVKLSAPNGDSLDQFMAVTSVLERGRDDLIQVLCIDISEWINKLNGKVFKQFLMQLQHYMHQFVIVFRVPFVDKEILENVKFAINDLMFVKSVTFPPFSNEEIQDFANSEFKRYGFSIDANAWDAFQERISEEKSDGKFYGLNTIKKVVRELLYSKQLNNAKNGKTDLTINKEDALAICSSTFDNNRSGYEMLDDLVGGEVLKARINEIIAQIEFARLNKNVVPPCIHMRFLGNPGTGKTTVARIIGKILKEKGVLRIGGFFEYAGRDFCGRYIGETAPKTASICRDAYGSVLFIDEAYSLYRGDGDTKDFGREAIDTLIAEMENHRSDLVVIMAGYTDDMDRLMKGNAGLASRMPYVIDFPNFTREELNKIFVSMLNKQLKYETDLLPVAKEYFENIPEEIFKAKEFSNARFVRNLFERMWAKASMRCQLNKIKDVVVTKADFERAIGDKEFIFETKKRNRIGFA